MVLRWTGRALILSGSLIVLFILYELYGTGFITSHDQHRLQHDFAAHVAAAKPSPTAPGVTSTASAGSSGPSNPAAGSGIADIRIPKIGLDMIVVEGVSVDNLKEGPGHYPGTPLPGQAGNVVISGHRTTYLHPFRNLDQLAKGDPIYLEALNGTTYTYDVTAINTVLPTDVAVVDNTADNRLTLTTCTPPFSASHRLIVVASLQGPPSSAKSA
ncbi:MAG TPA: class E sortase [Actinomycetota bacterium]|nr:class E sortase [Actinomycetota bacterium]